MQTIYAANEALRECIEKCLNCHQMCTWTIDYCLSRGNARCRADDVKSLQDCAEVCSVTADLLSRGSAHCRQACLLCADVCEKCHETFSSADGDDKLSACAELCRQCARICEETADKLVTDITERIVKR